MEKARFLQAISYDELIDLPDYKIDELLQPRVEKSLSRFPESIADDTAHLNKRRNRY